MAKRRSSSKTNFRTTAPKESTAIVSIIIFIIGLVGWVLSIAVITPYITLIFAVAYILLLAGVMLKGL